MIFEGRTHKTSMAESLIEATQQGWPKVGAFQINKEELIRGWADEWGGEWRELVAQQGDISAIPAVFSWLRVSSLTHYSALTSDCHLPPSANPPPEPLLVQLWNEMTRFFLRARAVPGAALKGCCCCLPWCVHVWMCVDNLLIKSGRLITLSSVWTKEKHPACSSISCRILRKRWFLFRWMIRC